MRSFPLPVVLAVLLLPACGDPPPPPAPDHEVIWESPVKLGGCAIGDADPDRPGLEVVAVDANGDLHLVYRDGDRWGHETIARTGGEKIQCAVGDLGPVFDGNAIAVVGVREGGEEAGGRGAVALVGKVKGRWELRSVAGEFEHLVHGVAIADVDPSSAGNELLVTGFDETLVIYGFEDGEPKILTSLELQAPGKAIAAWRGGVAIAEAGRNLEIVVRTAQASGAGSTTTWKAARVFSTGMAPQARIAETGGGARLLVACDDGTLRLFDRDDEGAYEQAPVLLEESRKLRGAAFGDFLGRPGHPVAMPATAGYEGKVTVFAPLAAGGHHPVLVYDDQNRLHYLAAGDLIPEAPGDELVTCGYSGRLVLIRPARRF